MRRSVAAACLALFLLFSDFVQAASARPNVLLICADDHAAYVAGCYGNKQARTPNIDRLAAAGMRFDHAYCNAPVCTASRAAFITGRYPRTVGVTQLRTPLPEEENTLADLLKAAGYRTAVMGKTHFNSGLKHGFDLLVGPGDHARALKARGRKPIPAGIDVLPPWKPFRDPARLWVNGVHLPYGAVDEDMWGTFYARRAAQFLRDEGEEPFFLYVSFNEPHSPFRYPVEYRDHFDPDDFRVPKVGPEDDAQIPAVFRDLTNEEKQGVQASYYTSTEFMDKNVGIVLDALEASGQAENTLVVYIGDHGYMLGQHGRIEKHCSYEEAVRAPLLFRLPKTIRPGSSTEAFTEFIDIVPTVLDLCGLSIPKNVQGRSLLPVLSGKTDKHREHVFVEYAQNDEVMVRDARYKLVYQRGKRRRTDGYDTKRPLPGPTLKLFDEVDDPGEFVNLADRPEQAQRVEHYVGLLRDFLVRTARQPERIPRGVDPMEILDYCVQPRDVTPPKRK